MSTSSSQTPFQLQVIWQFSLVKPLDKHLVLVDGMAPAVSLDIVVGFAETLGAMVLDVTDVVESGNGTGVVACGMPGASIPDAMFCIAPNEHMRLAIFQELAIFALL